MNPVPEPVAYDDAAEPDLPEELEEDQPRRWYHSIWARIAAWSLVIPFAAFTVVRGFGLERGWLMVVLMSFTPYIAMATLVLIVVLMMVRQWWPVAVGWACLVAMIPMLIGRVFPITQPQVDGPELRVMSVNLYVGQADLEEVVDLVDEWDVDLLSVQELTPGSQQRLTELGLDGLLPHRITEPGELATGTGIYSRFELRRLPQFEPDGIFAQPMAAVAVPGAPAVQFMAVHPAAPKDSERIPLWEDDLRALPPADRDGAVRILAGDFNATLDHELLRDVIGTGYRDAADAVGDGFTGTWRPTDGLLRFLFAFPGVTLDRVLVDNRVAVRDVDVLNSIDSDHRPVIATVQLPAE